ncbi:MAG: alkaline phosphatase D family protein [Pseudomonadota bacterium]
MSIKLGPILRFHGSDNNLWKVSVLLVSENEANAPTVRYGAADDEAMPVNIGSREFDTASSWQITRHDMEIVMTDTDQKISYAVNGTTYNFIVPAIDSLPRCGYASCNGFSDPKLMKKVTDQNERWSDLNTRHGTNAYHLLLMGGDQVYSDSMWDELPSLRSWSESDERFGLPFTESMRREVGDYYYQLYVKRWAQVKVSQVLASIPALMMWDDHDIFDGWGSYPEEQHSSDVYRNIFRQAAECFSIFQLHGASSGLLPDQSVYNGFYEAGKLGILVLDLRSERTQDQVISGKSWDAIYQRLGSIPENRLDHLFVMSSIPVVHADFNTLESLLGIIPGQQELEDDLRDHWLSRPHRGERIRLIRRLLDFAKEKNCRVTLLSGDVHLAALGTIESSQHDAGGNAHVINQLTSSGIVHPSPNATALFFLNQVAGNVETVDRDIHAQLIEFPTTRHCFIGARNWLALESDPKDNDQRRYWANWHVEGEKYPFTKVIHAADLPE